MSMMRGVNRWSRSRSSISPTVLYPGTVHTVPGFTGTGTVPVCGSIRRLRGAQTCTHQYSMSTSQTKRRHRSAHRVITNHSTWRQKSLRKRRRFRLVEVESSQLSWMMSNEHVCLAEERACTRSSNHHSQHKRPSSLAVILNSTKTEKSAFRHVVGRTRKKSCPLQPKTHQK